MATRRLAHSLTQLSWLTGRLSECASLIGHIEQQQRKIDLGAAKTTMLKLEGADELKQERRHAIVMIG